MNLYDTYPNDARHMAHYIAYQKRYAKNIRESDKVLLDLIARAPNAKTLLDIGCSTGNLLRHIHKAFPALALTGGDLSDVQLQECRNDAELRGIRFEALDIRHLPPRRFDVVVANAILYGFADEDFRAALRSMGGALNPGGRLLIFDFSHPFAQDVAIVERTQGFPDGHPLHFRPRATWEAALAAAGCSDVQIRPFEIPVDLPGQGADSVASYTLKTADAQRLLFRGIIFQPWSHIVAIKA